MKLNYGRRTDKNNVRQNKRVMLKDQHRIEFHTCRLAEELYTLIMLSGKDQQTATRCKRQGPFHSIEQALAASNAIATELEAQGYSESANAVIWQLQAQAQLRDNRNTRDEYPVSTDFVPLGVLPDSED